MPTDIVFPDSEPAYVFDRDVLAFRALAHDKSVQIMVTAELLMARFGARDMSEEALREAYDQHKDEIQSIARDHIEKGWVDEAGRVFLTTRFTRLKATFSERVGQWYVSRSLVDNAHRWLLELIGPNAGEVSVDWDLVEEGQGRPLITLRVAELSGPHSAASVFTPKEWENPSSLRVRLGGLWSQVLRLRSQSLILKSG